MSENSMTEREIERLAEQELARWREGESLTTLSLRAACHAAEREGDYSAMRELSALIGDREDRGDTA